MITNLSIENFRSIKAQNLELKKLNILYGPNGSGKSSVMYAPYLMRNFFVNPNQRVNKLFDFGFINLGGFDEVVSRNERLENINIKITVDLEKTYKYPGILSINLPNKEKLFTYEFSLSPVSGYSKMTFQFNEFSENLKIDLPYGLNDKQKVIINDNEFLWNGLTFELIPNTDNKNKYLSAIFNSVFESIKNIEIVSVKRGFFNPIFSTEQATDESLFAMQIRDEGTKFESKIDHYFKQIFNKTFRFVAIPGSTSFYLRTQNNKGFSTDLVNEGFGVNQTVYMLIKLLKKSTSFAFIEEPEIHIHPSAQNKLIDAFVDIIKNEDKQIFLSTHSENIVSSILTRIASGELSTNDVQFFLAESKNGETLITPQTVNDKGQLEGGLLSFMETELANLKSILGV
ncbi:MAG: AAA family ATPase [Ferruginibacter sp.]|nr:AAA family ATPase [Ferruginibacter sp.]